MAQKNLCICDSDAVYAEHLTQMPSERKEITFAVYFCSTWEHAQAFAKEQRIDILLIGEGYLPDARADIPAQKVFVLTQERESALLEGETGVYRYQSIEEIFGEIIQGCIDSGEEGLFCMTGGRSRELLAVYSPLHCAGKTTFAIEFGKELAKYGSVLYVNMEEYAGTCGYFSREEGQSLSDLLYYARQEERNLGLRLSTMVRQFGELDYIMPCKVCMDIKSVLEEEWLELLKKLLAESIYETVILDLGESIQGLLEILGQSRAVYMPMKQDRISEGKLEQYEEGIRLLGKGELMEKTIQMVLPENIAAYAKQAVQEKRKKESK